MEKQLQYMVAGVAVLALLVGGYAIFSRPAPHQINVKINPVTGTAQVVDENLGATTAGEISYWTGSGNFGADLAVGADFTVSGTSTQNGLASIVASGSFADATTTLFCVMNPFGVTSTADFGEMLITGPSTTTISLYMGTSTVAVGNTTTTLNTGSALIQVSSLSANSSGGTIVNNVNSATVGSVAAGTVARIRVLPSEYVCGVAGEDSGGSTAGVTNAANTFAGSYKIRWIR